ncbi:AMP-binding protein [Thalassobaculum sp.]|uniref:AMP-binding protein n=1 Tax=Thalassobaculum sp. TaxID=2022740 RepID=UPI0032EEDDCF
MTSLDLLLERAAARRGNAPAIRTETGTLSWAALHDRVRHVAGGLAGLGVGFGHRVAFWLPNGIPWLVLHLACARLGAVTVAINPRFRAVELADIVSRSNAKTLVLAPQVDDVDHLAVLAEADPAALDGLRHLIQVGEPGRSPLPGAATVTYAALETAAPWHLAPSPEDAPIVMFATSGTTARPKLVLHAQKLAVAHGFDVARVTGYPDPGSVVFHALPFCGAFGYTQLLGCLATGADMVVPTGFDPVVAARLVESNRVTHMAGSDDLLHRLLQGADALGLGERPFPHLRSVAYAAFNAALPDFAAVAAARGLPLRAGFGMSESFALFAFRKADEPPERRPVGGGTPVNMNGAARIVDPATGEAMPVGEPGALQIRSPNLMLGYDGDEAATEAAFTADRWLKTGDLGRLDGDGGFSFLGRADDFLRLSGFLVNPLEIEARILELPGIAAAQVVEAAARKGSRPVAFVVLEPGAALDEAAVIAHCKAGLAAFKAPVKVVALDGLPAAAGANGVKTRRGELRALARKALGR